MSRTDAAIDAETSPLPRHLWPPGSDRFSRATELGIYYALAVVFIWFGLMKFTNYEASSIAGLVMNSPLVSWWHGALGFQGTSNMLGVFEVLTGVLLALRVVSPTASAAGGAMGVITFLITCSFFFSTPGVGEMRAGGFPGISVLPGQFLLKDLVLLAASAFCLAESLAARQARRGLRARD